MRNDSVTRTSVVAASMVFACVCAMADEAPAGWPVIVPSPRHIAWVNPAAPGWTELSELKTITAPANCGGAVSGIEQLAARVRELNIDTAAIPTLDLHSASSMDPGAIHLGVAPDPALEARLAALPVPPAEGYRLVVEEHAVAILGSDPAGLYHGLMTLRQLLDARGRIARVAISDWPGLPLRGTYMGGSAGLESRILQCAALKLNLMLFESSDFFDLEDAAKRTRWQEAFALCRKHFIEPVPELQSFGWGQYVLTAHPAAAEGVYIDKQRFEIKNGAVESPDPPLAPAAPLGNAGFDDGDAAVITGWATDRPGDAAVIDRDGAHTGTGCLRLTRKEQGTVRVWQNVTVIPQHRYELSGFLRAKGIAHGTAYIEAYGLDTDGHLGDWLAHSPAVQGDSEWQRSAAAFDSGPYTRLQIYVRIQDAEGTVWFDDLAVTGTAGMNRLGNVLISPATPLLVQDEPATTTYEEGKDYRLLAAPVAFPYEVSAPLRIEIIPGGRLANSTAVWLSYHQAPQGSMTCCPSEPLYQEAMRAAIHTVVQCLKPAYIHIGHDEPRVLNRDRRCTGRHLSNSELFVDDIKRMRDFAHEADPAIRLMMWADAVNPYHNGPALNMNDAAALIPKDIIQCLWWYDWPDTENRIANSMKFFLDQGFEVTGSPWFNHRNVHQWAGALHKDRENNPHVLGEIYTSWSDTSEDPWQALATAAQYSWIVDKIPLEEFVK